LSLATRYRPLAESGHENIHAIYHNSLCDIDRSSLVCANNRLIACCCHQFCGGSKWPAKSAGDDEANDGPGEIE
jgi:hypothetical protein